MGVYSVISYHLSHIEILFNQPEIRLHLPFYDSFGTKRTSVWFQINRKMVYTISFRFDIIRFRKEFSLCAGNSYADYRAYSFNGSEWLSLINDRYFWVMCQFNFMYIFWRILTVCSKVSSMYWAETYLNSFCSLLILGGCWVWFEFISIILLLYPNCFKTLY